MICVRVIQANNLDNKDYFTKSDPFVIIKFANQQKETTIQMNTLNPSFNETFKFQIPKDLDLTKEYLEFEVYDYDRMKDNDFIGKAFVPVTSFMYDKTPQLVDVFLEGSIEGTLSVSLFIEGLKEEKTIHLEDDIEKYTIVTNFKQQ
ncbi:hypothetical protein ABK040_001509 [Willaertia magna]